MKLKTYIPNRTWLYSALVTLSFVVAMVFSVHAQNLPEAPRALVSDFTNTLSPAEKNALERKLLAFNDSTSTQIAVVLVQSTDGYDIADYAVRLAQKWGVGSAKYNNGIMLLAAIGDRAVTIQTGYGVEGALPDAIAHRIIENNIKPAFRQSAYYAGLDAATNSIISYTKGEYKAEPRSSSEEGSPFSGVILIIIIIIILAIISKKGGGNKGGKVMNGKGSSDLFWWMLLNGMGNSRGGDSGGFGGGFGGGSSGGGFGGFGGGGFGGGGASGRW